MTKKAPRQCEVVSGGMIFLDGKNMAFWEGVIQYGIELGMTEEALLWSVCFFYFFERRFHDPFLLYMYVDLNNIGKYNYKQVKMNQL